MNKEETAYFHNVEPGDKVFGLVYGRGIVRNVFDGYYSFEVEYENNHVVPYTEDGVPGWGVYLNEQTVFYKNDIDLTSFDITPTEEIPTPKKIIKYRNKNVLEMKCPSGIWRSIKNCPQDVQEQYLEESKFYLFRKA